MPVNSKGRLRYLDFLSSFNADKPATPPATSDSAKAQRGSSVPEVSDRGRSAGSSPTRDPKAGSKPRSHPCVSSFPSRGVSLGPRSPQARDFVSPRVRVTEKVSWNEPPGPGGVWRGATGGSSQSPAQEGRGVWASGAEEMEGSWGLGAGPGEGGRSATLKGIVTQEHRCPRGGQPC